MSENTTQTEGLFEGWVILELMGHRKLGGYVKEAVIAGAIFLRLDVLSDQGQTVATQFYSASSIYCISPVTREVAVAFGTKNQPTPVTRWELPPARPLPPHPDDAIHSDDHAALDDSDEPHYFDEPADYYR